MTIKLIASNVGRLQELNFVTGIQRVSLELHKYIFQNLDKSRYQFKAYPEFNSDSPPIKSNNPDILTDPIMQCSRANLEEVSTLLLFDFDENLDFNKISKAKISHNLKVVTNIYDLLPLSNPEWFPSENSRHQFAAWLIKVLNVSDHLIFNSNSTLQQFQDLGWTSKARNHVFQLGAMNSVNIAPTFISPSKTIICVSTLEPRKGHVELLNAYDQLLEKDKDFKLILVGRNGWKAEELTQRIYSHSEYGKRLRWYKTIQDDELFSLYRSSTVCVMPSFGEGFGLSIEEALSIGIPVIARDIPVFKERYYSNLHYFKDGANHLADQILKISGEECVFPLPSIRKMSDFGAEVLSLIDSIN
jgi:glycosyltransferase involved in cell wall biosynthesis